MVFEAIGNFFVDFFNSFSQMNSTEIIAQIIGAIAMCFGVSSFQIKKARTLVIVCSTGSFIWSIHFLLLGLTTGQFIGCFMNILCVVRGVIFAQKEKHAWARSKSWYYIFSVAFILFYALEFLFFGVEASTRNLILEILPVIACITGTISMGMKSSKLIRVTYFTSSPLWLVYDAIAGSVGGTLTEIFCMTSIVIGMIRLDRKKKNPAKTENSEIAK